MGGSNTFKIAQLLLALLGLIFSLTAVQHYVALIIIYVLCLIYSIIMMICVLFGKSFLSSTAQAVVEIFLGILLLAYTLHLCFTCSMEVLIVLVIMVGFVLPAFFFITAYEKM